MKTILIQRTICDKCKMVEDVEEGGQSQVTWREVTLEGAGEFWFCEKCVSETFGDKYTTDRKIAENARHLKSTEEITEHVDDLTRKVEDLTQQPMELNNEKLSRELERLTSQSG